MSMDEPMESKSSSKPGPDAVNEDWSTTHWYHAHYSPEC